MTYETLLYNLKLVYTYFLTMFTTFINRLSQYPLIMLSLFVLISLPCIYLLFSVIVRLSDTSDDMTTESIKIYRFFRSDKFKNKSKEMRKAFHRAKNFDDIPLKIPLNHQKAYDIVDNFTLKSSSAPHQIKRANIDVEVDDE